MRNRQGFEDVAIHLLLFSDWDSFGSFMHPDHHQVHHLKPHHPIGQMSSSSSIAKQRFVTHHE
jgi:hypothetical protein